jgi:geranylgeranyl pyrophosphate synthase
MGLAGDRSLENTSFCWTPAALEAADLPGFCAYVHPHAAESDLVLMTQWYVWLSYLADDLAVHPLRPDAGEGAASRVARLTQLMAPEAEQPSVPAPADALESGLADLWRRTATSWPEWRRRFAGHLVGVHEDLRWRSAAFEGGRQVNAIEYLAMRRRRGFAPWAVDLVELALGRQLPPGILATRPLQVARDVVADIVGVRDDIASCGQQTSANNGIDVLRRWLECDAKRAIDTAEDVATARLAHLEHTIASELDASIEDLELSGADRATVRRYLRALDEWLRGDWAWRQRSSAAAEGHVPQAPRNGRARTRRTVPAATQDHFAPPVVYMPFTTATNPHVDAIRADCKAWSEEMGLLDGEVWDVTAYDAIDSVLLGALTHPDASAAELTLICEWIIWGFFGDDLLVKLFRPRGADGADDLADARRFVQRQRLFVPLDGSAVPAPSTPFERALADLWERTAAAMSEDDRRRFRDDVHDVFASHLWELDNTAGRRMPEALDYLEMRRRTSGTRFTINLGRACTAGAALLREDVVGARPVRELVDIFGDWLGFYNDLVSFEQERDGGEINTGPRIVARLMGCDLQAAVELLNKLVTERLQQFQHIVAHELAPLDRDLRLSDDDRAAMHAYVKALEQWMAGAFGWASRTRRYSNGPAGASASTASPREVADVLRWGTSLVGAGLRDAMRSLPDATRLVGAYHMGWCDQRGVTTHGVGGKALRPTLVLLAAEATRGRYEDAMPAAVAIELLHNFSLLHDDVMDGDEMRRSRAATWRVFGLAPTILTGDALVTLAFHVLACSGHPRALDALGMLSAASLDLVHGQSADIAFELRNDVGLRECVTMVEGKTGALLGCACALGALMAHGTVEQIAHLRAFGERTGIAFQLVDDILGIWGDPSITGKPVYSDLYNHKKSVPVVAALRSGTKPGDELAALYSSEEPLSPANLEDAATLVEQSGGRAWCEAEAARQRDGALDHLAAAGVGGRAEAELRGLAWLVTSRDR